MGLLSCSSAQRDYLKPFGYGTLALPKASVRPLTMLAKRGDRLTPIGPLAGTFPPGKLSLPMITTAPTASISGSRSKAIDASLGLDILGAAIGALSGSTLGFKAAYKDASTVEFEFGAVSENSVNFTDLDEYMAATSPHPSIGPAIRDLLDEDEVFIVTSTIETNQISVKGTTSSGTTLGLDVPVVQQLVGGKIAVSANGASASTLTYTSTDAPLAIGASVVRVFFEKNRYRAAKLVKPGSSPLGSSEEGRSRADAASEAPDLLIDL